MEVRLPPGATPVVLTGYAVYAVCENVDGVCQFLRQDLRVRLEPPASPRPPSSE